jgi:hypothetical protein
VALAPRKHVCGRYAAARQTAGRVTIFFKWEFMKRERRTTEPSISEGGHVCEPPTTSTDIHGVARGQERMLCFIMGASRLIAIALH